MEIVLLIVFGQPLLTLFSEVISNLNIDLILLESKKAELLCYDLFDAYISKK